jgi:hypothetical protein|tara:strand:- start:19695 stop:19949 length:255 start_codon:yes stop_codon:yes gene_type:complete
MTDIAASATKTYVQPDGKPFGQDLLESLEKMKGASPSETSAIAMIATGISSLSGIKARNGNLHGATEHVLDVLNEKIDVLLDDD